MRENKGENEGQRECERGRVACFSWIVNYDSYITYCDEVILIN